MGSTEEDVATELPILPSLRYWLVTAGVDSRFTPFQGFGQDVLNPDFAGLMLALSVLPASVAEVFVPAEELPNLRRPIPPKRSWIVGLPSLRALKEVPSEGNEIEVFIGLPDEIAAVRTFVTDPDAIFVSTLPSQGVIALHGYQGQWAQLIDQAIQDALAAGLPESARPAFLQIPIRAPFAAGILPSRIGGVTTPNECLSMSLGYVYSSADPILDGQPGVYEEAILQSANHALSLIGEESTDTIVFAPSIVRHLYDFGSGFWNNVFRRIPSRFVRDFIKEGVFRNKGYSGFQLAVNDEAAMENPYDDPTAAPILLVRQTELRLSAYGVAVLACGSMQPAIRLPNAVNFHAAKLREIEQHANRDDPRGRRQLQRSYADLARKLVEEVGDRLITHIREKSDAITLVADAPIEWLPIDGVPLMIRKEVSRIGMTPGNLMLSQCLRSDALTVPAEALLDVLVVRSFAEDDPIRGALERGIEIFNLERVRVRFVDVARLPELVECLNAFGGTIVVFDCHGGHGGEDGHGWLKIGADNVDTWRLAHVARVPPIVILSACSTFALAGSHASVGNGLIRSGAVTVIGTFLSVNAVKSAAFVARLLYRIDAFLPTLRALDRNFVTWRTLVSTFLRMSYSTDVLRFFSDEKQWIQESDRRGIGVDANRDINSLHPGWYERLIGRIATAANRPAADIQSVLTQEAPLLETMYYCQIGRPEMLGIYLGDIDDQS